MAEWLKLLAYALRSLFKSRARLEPSQERPVSSLAPLRGLERRLSVGVRDHDDLARNCDGPKSRFCGLVGGHKPALLDLLVHIGHGPNLALGHGLDSLCPARAQTLHKRPQIARARADFERFSEMSENRGTGWWRGRDS